MMITMKRIGIYFSVFFLFLNVSVGCSSDGEGPDTSLVNTWVLVSYVNETGEVLKEANGYYYGITFGPNGYYSGRAYGNELGGKRT